MAIDPGNATEVAEALRQYVADKLHVSGIVYIDSPAPLGRGMDTRIYSFHLNADGLGPQWSAPLVLRVYTSADQGDKAQKEADVQAFAASQGYPAVEPVLLDRHAAGFDLPSMVMPRVAGQPMLELAMSSPRTAGRLLPQMADRQVALHGWPATACPLEAGRPPGATSTASASAIRRKRGVAGRTQAVIAVKKIDSPEWRNGVM